MKTGYSIFLLGLLAACDSNSSPIASTDSAYKTVVPNTPVINAEKYIGTLPCADCEGIDVSLQLNKNSDYIMNYVYKGNHADSTNNSYKETGVWSIHGNDTIYLTASKGGVTKYFKSDTALIQLDGDGNRITGPLAENYILHKR
jgi:uncharacterized lipoprotein NlpE involved in copper resistance